MILSDQQFRAAFNLWSGAHLKIGFMLAIGHQWQMAMVGDTIIWRKTSSAIIRFSSQINKGRKRTMSKIKRCVCMFCAVLCVVMACSVTCLASGVWSSQVVMSVPGLNGSANTKDIPVPIHTDKISEDKKCTFKTYTTLASTGADGRLINSDYESRSAWARNLDEGTTRYATTTAASGHYYYAEISSDLIQLTKFSIKFQFSPDIM